jgi:hypothetical protein
MTKLVQLHNLITTHGKPIADREFGLLVRPNGTMVLVARPDGSIQEDQLGYRTDTNEEGAAQWLQYHAFSHLDGTDSNPIRLEE